MFVTESTISTASAVTVYRAGFFVGYRSHVTGETYPSMTVLRAAEAGK